MADPENEALRAHLRDLVERHGIRRLGEQLGFRPLGAAWRHAVAITPTNPTSSPGRPPPNAADQELPRISAELGA